MGEAPWRLSGCAPKGERGLSLASIPGGPTVMWPRFARLEHEPAPGAGCRGWRLSRTSGAWEEGAVLCRKSGAVSRERRSVLGRRCYQRPTIHALFDSRSAGVLSECGEYIRLRVSSCGCGKSLGLNTGLYPELHIAISSLIVFDSI